MSFDIEDTAPVARELTGIALHWSRLRRWWSYNVSRRIPRLVWYGDELDVTITFLNDPLPDNLTNEDDAMRPLFSGAYAEMERTLTNMGITFDKGMGFGGRDWEWDWSLRGPVRVKFRSKARNPEKRRYFPPLKSVDAA